MEQKKVTTTAYYISVLGQMMEEKLDHDNLASAKAYVEQNMSTIASPKYHLSSTEKEEDGMIYDVSRFTIFNFSHVDIVDYTDGHPVAQEVELNNNTNTK